MMLIVITELFKVTCLKRWWWCKIKKLLRQIA